jgi:1,2-dihydroxy-3-keto-5-methylthiopentene dioxygenase
MTQIRVPSRGELLEDQPAIASFVQSQGLTYERWRTSSPLPAGAQPTEVLAAYAEQVTRLKERGGYRAEDVIQLRPDTPDLDALLDKFRREHRHDDDEVRFVIEGSGVFFINPEGGAPAFSIELGPGDLLVVPKGAAHWFDLTVEKQIRCIRLFTDPAGWEAHYTGSGAELRFERGEI